MDALYAGPDQRRHHTVQAPEQSCTRLRSLLPIALWERGSHLWSEPWKVEVVAVPCGEIHKGTYFGLHQALCAEPPFRTNSHSGQVRGGHCRDSAMTPAEARPPARSCDTSSRQIAQSNSTLNAWLPGRRQPSWLTSTAAYTPTPRVQQPSHAPKLRPGPRQGAIAQGPTPPSAAATTARPANIIEIIEDSECLELASSTVPQ